MHCSEIPDWFLRRRLPVLDLNSRTWQGARQELLPPGYAPSICLGRLVSTGRVRRLARGLYVVVDPARETPPIAIASAIYAETEHYLTTDAALVVGGSIDQPLPAITVVLPSVRRSRLDLGHSVVQPVSLAAAEFAKSDAYETTIDGFKVRVATRAQAVVDALAQPQWMTHGSLLREVIAPFSEVELEEVAAGAFARSHAAAQRLGYLIEEAGCSMPHSLATMKPKSAVELRPGRRSGVFSTRWLVHG